MAKLFTAMIPTKSYSVPKKHAKRMGNLYAMHGAQITLGQLQFLNNFLSDGMLVQVTTSSLDLTSIEESDGEG